ncbi:MAG: hypothetical protein OEW35_13870 [Gammaproteobacteria bacterium]|nr:hypothetical protein [Gammaproteobacteria bacterium]MDH4255945.1 hypothetical protein [Gammaproteobacteria bacterium]MDH5311857.1 hypothetical protein [Gammaproteobacteria bacterium]
MLRADAARLDLVTVIAIALAAFSVTNFLHEGAGHGGACVAVGGNPIALSSIHFECDIADPTGSSGRVVAAAGTIVNLIAGTIAILMLKSVSAANNPHTYFFVWLFATINLLMGAGYFLFSGAGNIGDWAVIANGLLQPAIWRPSLAIFGLLLYFLMARISSRAFRPLVGNDERSLRRGRQLAMSAYFAGGILYCVSGLFNPLGPALIAISAAAASFGGASGLLWLSELLRHFPGTGSAPDIGRSYGWIGTGVVSGAVFVALLGPGILF